MEDHKKEQNKHKLKNKIKEHSEDIINADDLKPIQDMYKSALSIISAFITLYPKNKNVPQLENINTEETNSLSTLLLDYINNSDVEIFKGLNASDISKHPSIYAKGVEISNRVSSKELGKEVFKRFENFLNKNDVNASEMIEDVLKSKYASKEYDNPALEYVNDTMSSFFDSSDDIEVQNVLDSKNTKDDDLMMSLFLSFVSQKYKDGAQTITGDLIKEKLNNNQGASIKDLLSVISKVVINKSQELNQKTNLRII